MYCKHKDTYVGVEYDWFKIKANNIFAPKMSITPILKKKMMRADSDVYATANAEAVDLQNTNFV